MSLGAPAHSRLMRAASVALLGALLAACASAPPAAPEGTPAATVSLAADNLAFDRDQLTVPANAPFVISFENRESPPHNVSVSDGEQALFVGEVFSGPDTRTYNVPPLAAGEYTFVCDLHPDMRGTVISQ